MSIKPVVVVGDGWAALGTVGFLASAGIEVRWIAGTGSRILPSMASLEVGRGASLWAELASQLGIECGEFRPGNWTREFRNKSFRAPLWMKAPTPDARSKVKEEELWEPERNLVGAFEGRFDMALSDLDEEIRKALLPDSQGSHAGAYPHLRREEGVPLTGFKFENDQIRAVSLGSGEVIECDQVVYADQWSLLPTIEGVPKPIGFLRKREPMGILQASFIHSIPVGVGVHESFFASLHRSAGDSVERHVWGHFFAQGKRSVWSVCLSPEEVQDNHEIGKKLRRLKSALDRIFEGSEIIPGETKKFAETVQEEQVHLEEEMIFGDALIPTEPLVLDKLSGVFFLTDGYGPASALQQVGAALGVQPSDSHAEAESVDLFHGVAPVAQV